MGPKKVKVEVYIPKEHLSDLAEALSSKGAGRIGNYDNCLSVTEVTGYWRPLQGAKPFQGEVGKVCSGHECKVEVQCDHDLLSQVIPAIRAVHPYEEPLINIIPLLDKISSP